MIEGYSIMDLVTLGGIITTGGAIVTTVGAIVNVIITNSRDTKALMREFTVLNEKYDRLRDRLLNELSREGGNLLKEQNRSHDGLSGENKAIKADTTYIRGEMSSEKRSREALYNNISNGQEILNKLDFMKEVIHEYARVLDDNKGLVERNKNLNAEIITLKNNSQEFSKESKDDNIPKLLNSIRRFEGQLGEFEMYGESEEIQFILKNIKNELSEFIS
ncbi:hypothetical protein LGW17_09265 [Streptococcus mutans]|uniref:hypothetical protein n=1 Tax=Streptococcus mutans TaxID=1309 RepID=UPI0002B4FB7D|nr:hypothetical protein [Streptococcus mutans]EMC21394.1 hypothetical protein SMU81_08295 [Streptococcus mutans SF14]MCB4929318.1 hypothetical protein [Streptococcus mutans]MCB4997806.1 hypothetical protein [Streptococcus mutans]MCB5039500.1 hypothetical protein [Streptococcus mutans]MCB5065546.1 hypothetical protein [Streptococcus mutans]